MQRNTAGCCEETYIYRLLRKDLLKDNAWCRITEAVIVDKFSLLNWEFFCICILRQRLHSACSFLLREVSNSTSRGRRCFYKVSSPMFSDLPWFFWFIFIAHLTERQGGVVGFLLVQSCWTKCKRCVFEIRSKWWRLLQECPYVSWLPPGCADVVSTSLHAVCLDL